ncbi:MAG: hypothetical protein AAGK05_17905 [Pseudomonadota bacterium]
MKNGYSEKYIEKVFDETDGESAQHKDNEKNIYWTIPYTAGTYQEIKSKVQSINKSLKSINIKLAFKTFKTQSMCRNKDKIKEAELSSIVYKYSCEQCNHCYIGETRRQFQQRINEHMKGRPPSEIFMHEHPPKIQNFKVIYKSKYTRTAETLLIKQHISQKQSLMNNHNTSEFLLLF